MILTTNSIFHKFLFSIKVYALFIKICYNYNEVFKMNKKLLKGMAIFLSLIMIGSTIASIVIYFV